VDPTDYQTYDWKDWSKLRPRDGDPFIRAVRFRLRVPEVITLTGYERLPSAAVAFSRRNIYRRDRFTCQYCGHRGCVPWETPVRGGDDDRHSTPRSPRNRPRRQPGTEELTIDHVLPRAQGGESRWDNCVLV